VRRRYSLTSRNIESLLLHHHAFITTAYFGDGYHRCARLAKQSSRMQIESWSPVHCRHVRHVRHLAGAAVIDRDGGSSTTYTFSWSVRSSQPVTEYDDRYADI
jgi:hypothetical protein